MTRSCVRCGGTGHTYRWVAPCTTPYRETCERCGGTGLTPQEAREKAEKIVRALRGMMW